MSAGLARESVITLLKPITIQISKCFLSGTGSRVSHGYRSVSVFGIALLDGRMNFVKTISLASSGDILGV